MKDELLFTGSARVGIEFLRIFAGTQCAQGHGLGFTTLENRRTVSARQHANLGVNRTNRLKITPIQSLVVVHDQTTNRFLLDIVESILENELSDSFFTKLLNQLSANLLSERSDGRFASQFPRRQQRGHDAISGQALCFL